MMINRQKQTRTLSLCFASFVAALAIIVWSAVRSYDEMYFFIVHFLIGLSVPFFFYAVGGNRFWFMAGVVSGAAFLLWLSLTGSQDGLAPLVHDWSHFGGGAFGLLLAMSIQMLYRHLWLKHIDHSAVIDRTTTGTVA